jgi:hypothetical protein
MDDPQLFGHALQLGGLMLVIRDPRGRYALIGAAAFFAAGVFVKHNLLVLPLAAVSWIALQDRKDAMTLVGAGAVFGATGLLLCRIAFGAEFPGQLESARTWSFGNLEQGIAAALPWMLAPFAGLLLLLHLERRDKHVLFCAIYAAMALAAGAIFQGGAGVDANALFDAAIAFSLASALILDRTTARALPVVTPIAVAMVIPLAISLVFSTDGDWYSREFWRHPMSDEAQTADADIAFLRAQKGPALCESLSLCYWAGKGAEVDVFNLGQAYAAHARSDGPLVNQIGRHHFAVIEFETLAPFQLTPAVLTATRRFYTPKRTSDDGTFFLPRDGQAESRDQESVAEVN